jgi:hypothetical protein
LRTTRVPSTRIAVSFQARDIDNMLVVKDPPDIRNADSELFR